MKAVRHVVPILIAAWMVIAGLLAVAKPAAATVQSDTKQALVHYEATIGVSSGAITCNDVAIQSGANDLFVSAELGYPSPLTGLLRARAGAVGPWEHFTVCTDPNYGFSVIASDANGLLVAAEQLNNPTDPLEWRLRARTSPSVPGPWEIFYLHAPQPSGGGIVANTNGDFVSAELGYSTSDSRYGVLRARATSLGAWEQFNIRVL